MRDTLTLRHHFYCKIIEAHKKDMRHSELFTLYYELLKTYTLSEAPLIRCVLLQCGEMCLSKADSFLLEILQAVHYTKPIEEDELYFLFIEYRKYEDNSFREVETVMKLTEYCLNKSYLKCFDQLIVSI